MAQSSVFHVVSLVRTIGTSIGAKMGEWRIYWVSSSNLQNVNCCLWTELYNSRIVVFTLIFFIALLMEKGQLELLFEGTIRLLREREEVVTGKTLQSHPRGHVVVLVVVLNWKIV